MDTNNADTILQECDVILKGGVTSGIVYPKFIHQLAQSYHFKKIGGTSAGAIVAGLTAAAEYGRRFNNNPDSFQQLAAIPEELGRQNDATGHTNLFSLFHPHESFRTLYELILLVIQVSTTSTSSVLVRLTLIVKSLLRYLWSHYRAEILIIIALWVVSISIFSMIHILVSPLAVLSFSVYAAFCAVILAIATVCARLCYQFLGLPQNFYGICSGIDTREPQPLLYSLLSGRQSPTISGPLTSWLNLKINILAGKSVTGDPLTFGEIWQTPSEKQIEFVALSTCLTEGKPYQLPFRNTQFYFKKEDFNKLFPKPVMDYLTRNIPEKQEFIPLPNNEALPLVVVIRMSLSFPLLLSAIPLYKEVQHRQTGKTTMRKTWFSDGGIVSNFPIHLFDDILPLRPTFGVNLSPYPAGENSGSPLDYWLPEKNNPDDCTYTADCWNYFQGKNNNDGTIIGFLFSIINAMQNWVDRTQIEVPGYRDRIVHIFLNSAEGGLNLDMSPEIITKISQRGKDAAKLLIQHYHQNPPPDIQTTWKNHCWVRYRTTMALLERALYQIDQGYNSTALYPSLIQSPPSYPFTHASPSEITAATREITNIVSSYTSQQFTFYDANIPKPKPRIRIRPDL